MKVDNSYWFFRAEVAHEEYNVAFTFWSHSNK
jgi:hypothetical protein